MIKGGLAAELQGLARELASDSGPAPVAELLEAEIALAKARRPKTTRMSTYTWLHIPGLLQTEAWARTVMTAYDADPKLVDTGWALREGRQRLVRNVPQDFFIGDAALRGSVLHLDSHPERRAAHHDQLAHLLEQAAQPTVSIRALPSLAETALRQSYHRHTATTIMSTPIPEFVVLRTGIEKVRVYSDGSEEGSAPEPTGILEDQPRERMLEQLAGMTAIALSPPDSRAYITEIMDKIASSPPGVM